MILVAIGMIEGRLNLRFLPNALLELLVSLVTGEQ